MGIKQKAKSPLALSFIFSFGTVYMLWASSRIYLSMSGAIISAMIFIYIYGFSLAVERFRREKLQWPFIGGGLALVYSVLFLLLGEPMNNLLNHFPGAIAFISGITITTGGLEYFYRRKNSLKAIFENKAGLYSFFTGWLNLILGSCIYIISFGPDHVIANILSVNFFSGLIGSFLLGFLPVYLYLKEGQKIPIAGAVVWSGIGIFTFLGNTASYPYSAFHQWTIFGPPIAGTYLFSGMLFISILIIYEHLNRWNKDRK